MSADTRQSGLDELRRSGLVTVRRKVVASGVFDVQRYRNVYTLVPDKQDEPAVVPPKTRSDDAEPVVLAPVATKQGRAQGTRPRVRRTKAGSAKQT